MISAALEHSEHKLRTRGLLKMLTTGQNFIKEKGFEELMPVYDVSCMDIQEYIKAKLLEVRSGIPSTVWKKDLKEQETIFITIIIIECNNKKKKEISQVCDSQTCEI